MLCVVSQAAQLVTSLAGDCRVGENCYNGSTAGFWVLAPHCLKAVGKAESNKALPVNRWQAWLQVKEQVQEFKDRQAVITKAESLAASYATREAALATREQHVAEQEDSAQRSNAAAEYARTEADAMWQKQKVVSVMLCSYDSAIDFPA